MPPPPGDNFRFRTPPRTIVVKIGSAVIAGSGTLDAASVRRLAAEVREVIDAAEGRRVVLVSSGAVASGYQSLGLPRPPKEIVGKQAAAAVGQPLLMAAWAEAFASDALTDSTPRTVAQVLLTAEDIDHRTRFLNARRTLEALLAAGVVPIINENDSVSYAEIKLGDNDALSSLVASLVNAELLVILSSVEGVWAAKPTRGSPPQIVPEIRTLAQGLGLVRSDTTSVGTGGMDTKLRAACAASSLGIGVVIASGMEPGVLSKVIRGEAVGTFFPPTAKGLAARKKWIGFSARPKGTLRVDAGAQTAIVRKGASLLPSGVVAVHGTFATGALVEIADATGRAFARGLTSYDSEELARIRGHKGREIATILGYSYSDEVVHRDDLTVLESPDAT